MAVRSHIKDKTCTTAAEAPALPPPNAFFPAFCRMASKSTFPVGLAIEVVAEETSAKRREADASAFLVSTLAAIAGSAFTDVATRTATAPTATFSRKYRREEGAVSSIDVTLTTASLEEAEAKDFG